MKKKMCQIIMPSKENSDTYTVRVFSSIQEGQPYWDSDTSLLRAVERVRVLPIDFATRYQVECNISLRHWSVSYVPEIGCVSCLHSIVYLIRGHLLSELRYASVDIWPQGNTFDWTITRRYMGNIALSILLPFELIDDGVKVVFIRKQSHHKGVQRGQRKLWRSGLGRAPRGLTWGGTCIGWSAKSKK